MANPNDQFLASRQQTWKAFTRLLLWGTVLAIVLALIGTFTYGIR